MRDRVLVGMLVLGALAAPQAVATGATLPERGQVTNQVDLPTTSSEAASFGRDVDGDGTRDNQLGSVLATFAQQGLDLGAAQDDAIATGDIVVLHSLRTRSLADSRNATWQVLHAEPVAEPDLDGGGTFEVATYLPRSPRLAARIKDHHVRTEPGRVPVAIDFGVPTASPTVLGVKKAVLRATCRRSGCVQGRIAGAVSATQVNVVLVPALADLFQSMIQEDCPGQEPSSCAADSAGKTVQSIFDANDDMLVSDDEVRDNELMSSLLAPDLDLVKASGKPGQDGVMDAISFGFGFTTASATLTRP